MSPAQIVSEILNTLKQNAKASVNILELEKIVEDKIEEYGAKSATKNYHPSWSNTPFPSVVCLGVNDVITHPIPRDYELKNGDLLHIDCTIYKDGRAGDCGMTIPIGNISKENEMLLLHEIDQEFIDWAIDTLSEQNDENLKMRLVQREALKTKIDGIERRIDNLNELMFSPKNKDYSLLTEDEYLSMKTRLVTERETTHQNYDNFDIQSDQVDELLIKTFNFSARLSEKFKNGDFETKRNILQAVGANLVLFDKKIVIQARKPFILLKELFEKVLPENLISEPNNRLFYQSNPQFHNDLYRVRELNP